MSELDTVSLSDLTRGASKLGINTVEYRDVGSIPSWINYVAKDYDGNLFGYAHVPGFEEDIGEWRNYYDIDNDRFKHIGTGRSISVDRAKGSLWRVVHEPVKNLRSRLGLSDKALLRAEDSFPDWVNYVAIDCDGEIYGYSDRPTFGEGAREWTPCHWHGRFDKIGDTGECLTGSEAQATLVCLGSEEFDEEPDEEPDYDPNDIIRTDDETRHRNEVAAQLGKPVPGISDWLRDILG